jgi:short-subunit dehydrogenase
MITSNQIKPKVALITGAASGLGLALAKACILENMHVVMVDIDHVNLDHQVHQLRLTAETEIIGRVCDVSQQDEVQQLAKNVMQHFGHIDLLINNAGISGPLAPLWAVDVSSIRHVLDVNLYGIIHCVQAFLPFMFEQENGAHIVNMASFYGLCSGSQMAPYAISKHGIVALSESLYFDLRRLKKPVNISVVCPSFINTKLLHNSRPLNHEPHASSLQLKLEFLMERSRPADDVAECIMRQIKNKNFYILPDYEVKDSYEQRAKAIIAQHLPHEHHLEKICSSLSKRSLELV